MNQAVMFATTTRPSQRPVGQWLLICAGMVFFMIVLGGLTRLTDSGLSMMDWKPLSVLPPMTEADWIYWFERYQQIPQYKNVNAGMTLAEFKGIFWLEYLHRLWGRFIGVVFLVPFLWFLWRGLVTRDLARKLAIIFMLGGLQGALGWFMVASGFTEAAAVSQYRLAAHLMAAVLIYGAILWVAFGLLHPERPAVAPEAARLRRRLAWLLGLSSLVILTGAFVAGLDAGLIYNTFPLMNGHVVPPEFLDRSPWYLNFFENHATVQFTHRLLAITAFILILAVWWTGRNTALPARAATALRLVPLAAVLQVTLGISTLLLAVPVSLAALHQAGALVLFSALLWAVHELTPRPA